MKQKRVLITGASGMLGGTLVKYFTPQYDVFATSNQLNLPYANKHMVFDLNDKDYSSLIEWSRPDVIIHTAALTNGNLCDTNPELAIRTNSLVLDKLALAIDISTRLFHISTDAVFSEEASNSNERDTTSSDSVYGKSKELGEFFLKLRSHNFTIVRTTIVGLNQLEERNGFTEWIINSAKESQNIGLFDDVKFTPITCIHLAEMLKVILENGLFKNEIVHIGSSEIYTKYDFGVSLLKAVGFSGENVYPSKLSQFKGRAKRSMDQSLDSSYFERVTGIKLPNLEKTIQQLKIELNEQKGN